ncbi:MAG: TIGR01777 family protein [Actinobacteria bacterium 13_1_20CM_3_68_9]|nr:MAG: TIGR01777 family protein [Actinobacteria bacterium 13_1_20CM_3_68_9]
MRVLVTGASGFLGSAVCDALLARGDETVGLSRNPERARQGNPTVTWHGWNSTAERPPASALEGVDGIVNVIGEPIDQRWTEAAKLRIRDSRVRATKNLVDAISAADPRPKALVSQSAVGYYGDRGDALVDESSGPGSSFDSDVCAAWEEAAHEAGRVGVRVAVTRTGLVLDREHGLLKQLLLPFKLGVGGPIAGGGQYMSWIHVDDEVRLMLWALDTEQASGTYNATAPNPVTNREFSRALGRVLGRPALVPVPKLALKVRFGDELGEVAAGGQRVVPRRAVDAGFEFRHAELEPALRDLLRR